MYQPKSSSGLLPLNSGAPNQFVVPEDVFSNILLPLNAGDHLFYYLLLFGEKCMPSTSLIFQYYTIEKENGLGNSSGGAQCVLLCSALDISRKQRQNRVQRKAIKQI